MPEAHDYGVQVGYHDKIPRKNQISSLLLHIMALPVNIEELLSKHKIESNRIEFKRGWNPEKIYRSICAFANDFDNLVGGYILVGVEEDQGVAKRPVRGLDVSDIDGILKDMVGFNNKIYPYYLPRTEIAEIDNQNILIIWVPSGVNRPYSVAENVLSPKSVSKHYIRSGSTTIEAKGEVLDELRDAVSRTPFDERGNPDIKIEDISPVLVLEYLTTVKSKLASDFHSMPLEAILEQMDLYVGSTENRMLKNIAAMMFCKTPEKFFPYTQVDIVIFPEGAEKNPNNMLEIPKITGPIPQMIQATLNYMRTFVIREHIIKPNDRAESMRVFNYPYQALEESIVNALYHRDYMEREPVEITIEPNLISILSFAGPDRSISMEAIQQARRLKSRRYRNRRLGDFLKELNFTEGRSTGIPTIQDSLEKNGSAPARIITDEDRTSFLMEIPCRNGEEGVPAIENLVNEQINEQINLSDQQKVILRMIAEKPSISFSKIASVLSVKPSLIRSQCKAMEKYVVLKRNGSKKTGTWQILFVKQ